MGQQLEAAQLIPGIGGHLANQVLEVGGQGMRQGRIGDRGTGSPSGTCRDLRPERLGWMTHRQSGVPAGHTLNLGDRRFGLSRPGSSGPPPVVPCRHHRA